VEGLARTLEGMGFDHVVVSQDALWEAGSKSAISERLQAHADELLERKAAEYGAETWAMVERLVLLRTIDTLWVEHLTEIDDMRRGIGLRGYSGEDPLNAFKKVAFQLYEELRGFIRRQVASTTFRVSVTHHPDTVPMPGPGQPARAGEGDAAAVRGPTALAPAATRAGGAALLPGLGGRARPPVMREQHGDEVRGPAIPVGRNGPKLGRNDPCYCGSGRKYKKCHGR
jgi:preprotein translocase subunit SecA